MEADFLFNITQSLGKSGQLCSVEATDGYNGVLLGTPGIATLDSIKHKNPSARAFFVFPPNTGINAGSVLALSLVHNKNKPVLFDDYKIKEVETFGFDKLNDIYDFVLKKGGLSVVVNNCEEGTRFVEGMPVISEMFNYNSVIQSSNYNPPEAFCSGIEEEVNVVVTFLRLDHCIPIFNTKKVEGMGVICTLFPKNYSAKHSVVYKIREFSMLLSSFKDNVFVIDGEKAMPINPLTKDMKTLSDFQYYSSWKKDGDKFDPETVKPKAVKAKPKAKKKRMKDMASSKYCAEPDELPIYKEGTESDNGQFIVRNGRWVTKEQPVDDAPDTPKSYHDFVDTSTIEWSSSSTNTTDGVYYVNGSSKTSNRW